MSKPSPSPLEQIHNAIKSQNIFKGIGVFRSDNVWGQGHPDVVSFNAHASDTVFQALDHVRQDHNQKVTSLVFTATPGQGKTHLINRIRRQLINENDTIFVYVNVLNFTDLDQINFYFQQTIVDSLSRSNSQEITQWQALASTIVNSVIPNPKQPQVLINQFDKVYQDGLQKGSNLIDLLIRKLNIPNYINPYIVRTVLWMLSPKVSSYAERWLAGEILEASHAQYLGIPPSIHGNQDQESSALNVVKQILNLIDRYSSIIICFDELDTADNSNNDGLRTEQVVAVLVKSLYDTLEQYNLSKGVIILMVMMQDTYINLFTSMQYGGVHERICAFTQNKPIELEFIVEPNSMIELVTLYLSHFYHKRQLVPPEPIYPFTTDQLKKYVKVNRPTMREALKWCAENFKVDETDLLPESPDERIELALSRENDINLSETLEDSQFIGNVLRFGFTALIGQSLSGKTPTGDQLNNVIVQEIVDIAPKAKNNDWINFKILGTEQDQPFKLGVMVLQHTHGLSVGAGMHRLVDYKTFDLNRGCLVRSKSRKIKSHWDSSKLLTQLVEQQDGEWVDLELENIELLIKLYIVNEQKDIYNLTDDQVFSYTQATMLTNPVLLEILSPPSGNMEDVKVIDPVDLELMKIVGQFNNVDQFNNKNDPTESEKERDVLNGFTESESISGASTTESFNSSTEPVEPASQSDLSATTSEDQTSEESATPETVNPPAETWLTRDYRGMNIASFSLNGTEYEVTTWRELLIMTCALMKLHHNKDFAKVLEIRGRKNSYFSKNAEDLKNPEKISGSGLYVETNLSSNQIVKFVHRIITIFGYAEDSLDIQTHE